MTLAGLELGDDTLSATEAEARGANSQHCQEGVALFAISNSVRTSHVDIWHDNNSSVECEQEDARDGGRCVHVGVFSLSDSTLRIPLTRLAEADDEGESEFCEAEEDRRTFTFFFFPTDEDSVVLSETDLWDSVPLKVDTKPPGRPSNISDEVGEEVTVDWNPPTDPDTDLSYEVHFKKGPCDDAEPTDAEVLSDELGSSRLINLERRELEYGETAAVWVVAIDEAGNRGQLSSAKGCVERVPVYGFCDAADGGCPATCSAGPMSSQGAVVWLLASLTLRRRRR